MAYPAIFSDVGVGEAVTVDVDAPPLVAVGVGLVDEECLVAPTAPPTIAVKMTIVKARPKMIQNVFRRTP